MQHSCTRMRLSVLHILSRMALSPIALSVLAPSAIALGPLVISAPVARATAVSSRWAVLTSRTPGAEINIRSAPTVEAVAHSYGLTGDAVEILSKTSDRQGQLWYRVRFRRSQTEGWVYGSFVRLVTEPEEQAAPSRVHPQRLGTASSALGPVYSGPVYFEPFRQLPVIPAAKPEAGDPNLPEPIAVPSERAKGDRYTTEQINYFLNIALGSEFGSNIPRIKKWDRDIAIRVYGKPTAQDYQTLQHVIGELNPLIQGIQISLVSDQAKTSKAAANLEIHFAPERTFSRILPDYQPTNYGFFWTWWDNEAIRKGTILITTEGVTQQERSHLIREELTQALGLMQDSWQYPQSVFYQGWTDVNEYTDLDRTLIRMLYQPRIQPGMDAEMVRQILGQG